MDLDAYLQRIGIPRRCAPDLAFLRRMHRAHLRTIPYENLDVLLGRELSVDGDRAFDKLVRGNRGGWCFEMNALFASALEAAGYRVRTLASVIKRDRWNRPEEGAHPLHKERRAEYLQPEQRAGLAAMIAGEFAFTE